MHILLTGGTGLIGRALCQRWLADGHQLTVLSRRPQSVASLCGRAVRGISQFSDYGDEPLDAIVNLAGEPIADRPWSNKRKAQLWGSRITLTEQMLEWLEKRDRMPQVLLNGSAVGWYGDGGERELTEASPPITDDFASQLCVAWEETAQRAEALGIRVVLVRTGLVLARDGGFLKRLVPPFKLGLGGPLGNGRQWMPWVHLNDQIALMDFLLRQTDARGPYNACSPQPVRNRDFARSLGRALGRPAIMPAPAFVLRLMLGELAGLLLGGQRAVPSRLRAAGFTFAFTDLDMALGDLLKPKDV